jgi:hypothetical protein
VEGLPLYHEHRVRRGSCGWAGSAGASMPESMSGGGSRGRRGRRTGTWWKLRAPERGRPGSVKSGGSTPHMHDTSRRPTGLRCGGGEEQRARCRGVSSSSGRRTLGLVGCGGGRRACYVKRLNGPTYRHPISFEREVNEVRSMKIQRWIDG